MPKLPAHLLGVPIGERELARETKVSHQRRRILQAAIGVFAKRGYQATKVSHVVKAASSSTGHFYSLFESKEACFLAAYDLAVAEGSAAIAARIPAGTEWPEQVSAALAALIDLVAERNLAARLVIVETQSAGAAALVPDDGDSPGTVFFEKAPACSRASDAATAQCDARSHPSHSQSPVPMIQPRSSCGSQGISSVNIVTHCR